MFEKAARMKLRFNHKGLCSVEDLWDLPVDALDTIYGQLSAKRKAKLEDSLLKKQSTEDAILDLQIEIITHIVGTKLAERVAREEAAEKRAQKQKLRAIIAQKEDSDLLNKSLEELKKMESDL